MVKEKARGKRWQKLIKQLKIQPLKLIFVILVDCSLDYILTFSANLI